MANYITALFTVLWEIQNMAYSFMLGDSTTDYIHMIEKLNFYVKFPVEKVTNGTRRNFTRKFTRKFR